MSDYISRQAAIDALHMHLMYRMGTDSNKKRLDDWINGLPSAQETHEERAETHACDCISRQAAIDALDVLCQEHRYKIPGKRETYSQYNEAWQDALDRAEGAIFNLPSAQPEMVKCKKCRYVYYDEEFGNYWCDRMSDPFRVEADGYCKWGK